MDKGVWNALKWAEIKRLPEVSEKAFRTLFEYITAEIAKSQNLFWSSKFPFWLKRMERFCFLGYPRRDVIYKIGLITQVWVLSQLKLKSYFTTLENLKFCRLKLCALKWSILCHFLKILHVPYIPPNEFLDLIVKKSSTSGMHSGLLSALIKHGLDMYFNTHTSTSTQPLPFYSSIKKKKEHFDWKYLLQHS